MGEGVRSMAEVLLGRDLDDAEWEASHQRAIQFLRGPVRDMLRAEVESGRWDEWVRYRNEHDIRFPWNPA